MNTLCLPLLRILLLVVACFSAACQHDPDAASAELSKSQQTKVEPSLQSTPEPEASGAIVYQEHCAHCHNGTVSKAPHVVWLSMLSPKKIYSALHSGVMKVQASALSDKQQRDVAEYLSNRKIEDSNNVAYAPQCDATKRGLNANLTPSRTGWGHDTARFIPDAVAGLKASDVPKLALKWVYAFPEATRARSQPAVGFGAVYVGSEDGNVYAFDVDTGCAYWRFEASAEVRTAIVLTPSDGDRPPLAVFGDVLANLYAINAITGELVWRMLTDEHPSATLTGTPALSGNTVYVPVSSLEVVAAANPEYECCSFRGSVIAVELATGNVQWQHFTVPEKPSHSTTTAAGTRMLGPSGAPIWGSPAVDTRRGLLYVGTGENYSSPADGNSDAILAIALDTGERAWTQQLISGDAWNTACALANNPNCPSEKGPDYDYGASPILMDLGNGKQVIAAGSKNGVVTGHDPDNNGQLLWKTRVGRGSIQGGIHFGMAAEATTLYAPVNDMNHSNDGSELDDSAAKPGVNAINAANGDVLWSHLQKDSCPADLAFCDPGVSAAVTAIPGVLFAGHLDGVLRAYDKQSGKVIWQFDANQTVTAVNGLTATGGSFGGPGATLADGYLFINSGYGYSLHMPGNMFAVFAIPER